MRGQQKGWSIELTPWKALKEVMESSSSWRCRYGLSSDHRDSVPEKPGVYVICAQPPIIPSVRGKDDFFPKLVTPLYVGLSKPSIRDRFSQHVKSKDPDMRKAKKCDSPARLQFWFTELPCDTVDAAEEAIYDCFGPPVNKRTEHIKGTLRDPVEA